MKKLLICLMLAFVCLASNAQIANPVVKKSYKELKGQFNPREYVATFSDKYSPAWCGVGSFFIPGLGDAICGEWGRGICQFLGSGLLAGFASACMQSEDIDDNANLEIAAMVSAAGALAIDIWSIFDAVKIAKVKNMYYQSAAMASSVDIKLSPKFACVNSVNGTVPTAGLALNISF